MTIEIICADVLEWAAEYDGPPFHAVLTDPPYHLTQPNIRNGYNPTPGLSSWDAVDEARKLARQGVNSGGFMGKQWDGGDVAFRADTWAAIAKHLHPGAFGMAFSGARTYHRMACAIEDAGMVLHSMVGWVYGSGFPKATRIDTQIDKAAGAERTETRWVDRYHDGGTRQNLGYSNREGAVKITPGHNGNEESLPATPLAATWSGHRYGLQALKPALEPICVWQVPYSGRPVDCITETGAGSLWIDGARVETEEVVTERYPAYKGTQGIYGEYGTCLRHNGNGTSSHSGRWPANLCLGHAPECVRVGEKRVRGHSGYPNGPGGDHSAAYRQERGDATTFRPSCLADNEPWKGYADADGLETVADWDCADGCAIKALGEQSDVHCAGAARIGGAIQTNNGGLFGIGNHEGNGTRFGDSGSCARFFTQVDWALEQAEPLYCALCLQPITKHGIMNETQQEGIPCNVNGAEASLNQSEKNSGSVLQVVQRLLPPSCEGNPENRSSPAQSAENDSGNIAPTATNTVPESARRGLNERCAQAVKSAGVQCDSCATDIAQSLAQMLQDPDLASTRFLDSTTEYKKNILIQNLARSVAQLGNTDIIQIMQSLPQLCGFVQSVITAYTQETEKLGRTAFLFHEAVAKQIDAAEPMKYQSKASRRERDAGLEGWVKRPAGAYVMRNATDTGRDPLKRGNAQMGGETIARNPHPTVKPIALARHLATLLLPPPEYAPRRLLIPFGGVGSEAIGAMLAGWDEIVVVEMDAEYCEIARARVDHWAAQEQAKLL